MKRLLPLLALTVLVGACTSTAERPMRESEATVISAEVSKRLDEAGGTLDTREHADVRCDRVQITGSHMVTRVCYTLAEDESQSQRSQDRLERIMNDTARPRSGN